jgi:hypothetical protein
MTVEKFQKESGKEFGCTYDSYTKDTKLPLAVGDHTHHRRIYIHFFDRNFFQ